LVPVILNRSFLTSWLFDVEMFIRLKGFFGKDQVMNYIIESADMSVQLKQIKTAA